MNTFNMVSRLSRFWWVHFVSFKDIFCDRCKYFSHILRVSHEDIVPDQS